MRKYLVFFALLLSLHAFAVTKFDDAHLEYWKTSARTSPYPRIRKNAARMLGKLGDARAVATLTEIIQQDAEATVRSEAAIALGKHGEASAIEALTYMMNHDDNKDCRQAARQAIDRIYLKINLRKDKKEKLGKLFGIKTSVQAQ